MGISDNLLLFMLVEFFNALSLGMMSGTFDSYLYDHCKSEEDGLSSQSLFSVYYKYQYMFMGLTSLVGAVAFYYLGKVSILFSASLMFMIFIASLFIPSDKKFSSKNETINLSFTALNRGLSVFFQGGLNILLC